jgi:hypothetical protein
MLRTVAVLLMAAAVTARGTPGRADPPTVYEVQINGESFLVEANRQTNLESKEKPGVRYKVAIRVAPTQRVTLKTLQFEYDLPAKVEVDGRGNVYSARLTHELGFSLLIRDLGGPLDSRGQQAALDDLMKSVVSVLRNANAKDTETSEPFQRKFANSSARGFTIRYRDAKGLGHVYLVCILNGPSYTAACVVEFLDNDSDDVLPLIKKTLDSVCPIDRRPAVSQK